MNPAADAAVYIGEGTHAKLGAQALAMCPWQMVITAIIEPKFGNDAGCNYTSSYRWDAGMQAHCRHHCVRVFCSRHICMLL